MNTQLEESFLDYFKELEDPRSERNRLYSISEILFTTFCAVICGGEGWQDIEDFGKAKIDYLRNVLPYNNGIPSDDTFRRFFRSVDPTQFQALFRRWLQDLNVSTDKGVISIDGKSSRHSFDEKDNMLHMISAFASEARIVLGQEKVSDKSNEITAIPSLLEWLDIRGSTVTIDAMGAQYKIAKQILEQGGQYIFSLKGNQGNLHEDVKLYFEEALDGSSNISSYEDFDKGHGRIETRNCVVCNDVNWLKERHANWSSIQSIIQIKSSREIKGKTSHETRYYIASIYGTAEQILNSIRRHWSIENSLHWILDMSFGEDQSRIRKENAPHNMAIIRHVALNLLQLAKQKMKRQSIKRLRKMAGWKTDILLFILNQKILK